MTSRERLGYRRSTVGFIWQQTSRNLLPYLTALQNVIMPMRFAGRPQLLIADEPTSQLDLETGRQIMRLLLTVVRSEGITALVATHDEALIDLADEVLQLEDGHIVD